MARKIRFPLHMGDGTDVRTIEELQEHFDIASVLGYFTDGKLKTWLEDRYYNDKAAAVGELTADMPDLSEKLCIIFGIESDTADVDIEEIQRRKEKLKILSTFTADTEILDKIDLVAMDQDELFDILDMSQSVVYLYKEMFSIPFGKKDIKYIGMNGANVTLESNKNFSDYRNEGIIFENIESDENNDDGITVGEQLFLKGKYNEAFDELEKAASDSDPRAMFLLSRYYMDCYNVVKANTDLKKYWLEKASHYDEPLSLFQYAASLLQDNKDEQNRVFEKIAHAIIGMAESGDILAQRCLGCMYGNGYGVEEDDYQSYRWYLEAAEHGLALAQCDVYRCLSNGTGVEKDYSKAIGWIRKSADQGNAYGQYYLALCYYDGEGVEKDYPKAIEWFHKAADQGDPPSQRWLGTMYIYGEGVEKDYSKAVEWFRKAADQGDAYALRNLAECYLKGLGVEPDMDKALDLSQKAEKLGVESIFRERKLETSKKDILHDFLDSDAGSLLGGIINKLF